MDGQRVEIGCSQDLAIFQDGLPVAIVELQQVANGVTTVSVNELGPCDYNAVLRLLALVADAFRNHARQFEPDYAVATDAEIEESIKENNDIPF